jgi:serine/threonine protein kinase
MGRIILLDGRMALGIGQSLGNYRIVQKLGAGAMGTVYLAERETRSANRRSRASQRCAMVVRVGLPG